MEWNYAEMYYLTLKLLTWHETVKTFKSRDSKSIENTFLRSVHSTGKSMAQRDPLHTYFMCLPMNYAYSITSPHNMMLASIWRPIAPMVDDYQIYRAGDM